ncbi:MAG: hypothetical protein JXR97_11610, partial [Planctomycetes bacterium]|nr:hypothetical protein [Planctomycetota bacterium]
MVCMKIKSGTCMMALCGMFLAGECLGAGVIPPAQPPLLNDSKGKEIKTIEQWEKRRAELLKIFETEVYGKVPETKYKSTWTVEQEDAIAMEGKATLRLVAITTTSEYGSHTFRVNILIPNKREKPAPAFILICNRSPKNIDPTRKEKSEFWPAEQIVEAGFAAAAFHNAQVAPDKKDADFKKGIFPVLDGGKRDATSWGAIAAWAWGASRVLDYMTEDKDI